MSTTEAQARGGGQPKQQAAHNYAAEAKERVYQTGERLVHSADEMLHDAQRKAMQVPQQTRSAWRDTLTLMRNHPLWTAFLLTSLIAVGMGLATSGFTLGLLTRHGRDSFSSGYSKGSAQYKAHQALDTVLNSYYGPKESMSDKAMGKLQSSYNTLGSILSNAKDSMMHPLSKGKTESDDEHHFSLLHPLGGKGKKGHASDDDSERHYSLLHPLGGKGKKSSSSSRDAMDEDADHGFLGNMADKVKSWTGHSDLDDVEQAEEKLRKVLKSHKRIDD